MHFPRLDVSSIEGFKKKIQRFNSYISLEFEYASSQSSSSQSYRASQDPPCSDDSPVASIDPVDTPADTVDETCIEPELGCACDLCNDPNCNKNRRIKELEDKIANEQQVQATFFVCLFGLFCKTRNISCRNAALIIAFIKQFFPSFNCPSRQKTYFADIIYCLPSILKIQIESFVTKASSLVLQLDGSILKQNVHVFTLILFDDGMESVCYNIDAQSGQKADYIFELVMNMFGDHAATILSKLRAIVSDRASTQLKCNRKLVAKAAEYGNNQVTEVACSLHCAENTMRYGTELLLNKDTLDFLKTVTRIFAPNGTKFTRDSAYIELQMYAREQGITITFIPMKGTRFISLPLNCRMLLQHFDLISRFCQRLLLDPRHKFNNSLKLVMRTMNQGPYSMMKLKAELYLFAGVSNYFILPVWKASSKCLKLFDVRDHINNVLEHCFRIIMSDQPIQVLTTSPDQLKLDVDFSDTAVAFSVDFVDFFDNLSASFRPEFERKLKKYFDRVKDKYIADNDVMMTQEDLSDEAIMMFLPSSNQRVESSFAVLKTAQSGYDFGNLVKRSLFQFNRTLPWLLEQENCLEIVEQALKERRRNKALKLDLIESLVATDFNNIFTLPDLSEDPQEQVGFESDSSEAADQVEVDEQSATDSADTQSVMSTTSFMSTSM